jgi:N-acetylglucosaminyldiphosphoundecaprenol N-acetyl-beta-D-mannosaminyltransferase
MGVNITPFDSYNHAVECVFHRIATGPKTFCVAINPEKVYNASKEPDLAAILKNAEIQICDGIGIVYATKLLLGRNIERCTGIEFFFRLISKAAKEGLKVFLLGASTESNESACSNLLKMYSDLKIAGCHNGYFNDSNEITRKINESQADMLFVAMGSPKQELWIAKHREAINTLFCMGVGGVFDIISGYKKWAPKVCRKTGTEFLYRLVTEPQRWKRQLVLPKFVLMVLKEKVFHSNGRGCYF